MIKKFINIIKLTKYNENSLINFLSFLVFEGFGLYLMLTTESTLISCLLLFVGSFMLATIFYIFLLQKALWHRHLEKHYTQNYQME